MKSLRDVHSLRCPTALGSPARKELNPDDRLYGVTGNVGRRGR